MTIDNEKYFVQFFFHFLHVRGWSEDQFFGLVGDTIKFLYFYPCFMLNNLNNNTSEYFKSNNQF